MFIYLLTVVIGAHIVDWDIITRFIGEEGRFNPLDRIGKYSFIATHFG